VRSSIPKVTRAFEATGGVFDCERAQRGPPLEPLSSGYRQSLRAFRP
jgi:hypothetical protein